MLADLTFYRSEAAVHTRMTAPPEMQQVMEKELEVLQKCDARESPRWLDTQAFRLGVFIVICFHLVWFGPVCRTRKAA